MSAIRRLFLTFRRKPSIAEIRRLRALAIAKAKEGGPGRQVAQHHAKAMTTAELSAELGR